MPATITTRNFYGAAPIEEQKLAGATVIYFAYPADPATQPVKVYGQDQGIFDNGKYDAVAKHLLTASAQ